MACSLANVQERQNCIQLCHKCVNTNCETFSFKVLEVGLCIFVSAIKHRAVILNQRWSSLGRKGGGVNVVPGISRTLLQWLDIVRGGRRKYPLSINRSVLLWTHSIGRWRLWQWRPPFRSKCRWTCNYWFGVVRFSWRTIWRGIYI